MAMNEPMSEWIRLMATPRDKALLEAIQKENEDDSFSATVRRLIRQEAKRLGLTAQHDAEQAVLQPDRA